MDNLLNQLIIDIKIMEKKGNNKLGIEEIKISKKGSSFRVDISCKYDRIRIIQKVTNSTKSSFYTIVTSDNMHVSTNKNTISYNSLIKHLEEWNWPFLK